MSRYPSPVPSNPSPPPTHTHTPLGYYFPPPQEFDEDKNGYLDRREFKECLQSAQLGLSPQEIMHIMAEVDENDDGVVEYNEFMPLAVELLQSLQVKEDVTADAIDMREAARAQAEQYLDSMGRDALQEKLSQLFIKVRDLGDMDFFPPSLLAIPSWNSVQGG